MKKALFIVLSVVLLAACSGNGSTTTTTTSNTKPQDTANTTENTVTLTGAQIKELKTAAKIVYTLPSPTVMASILHETEAEYDVELLNSIRSMDNYVTDLQRALNMGVYFADLSFTSMFDHPQEAMKFMAAAQQLSEQLNIVGVFTEDVRTKLESNLSNKDSLMGIVSNAYMETDNFLNDNERPVIAKTILAGAWIEGLYIAVNLKTNDTKQQEVWNKIGEQQPAMNNLVNLIEGCSDPKLADLLKELKELQAIFTEVKLDYGPEDAKVETDTVTKTTKIGGELKITISKETVEKLKAKTVSIRQGIVKGG